MHEYWTWCHVWQNVLEWIMHTKYCPVNLIVFPILYLYGLDYMLGITEPRDKMTHHKHVGVFKCIFIWRNWYSEQKHYICDSSTEKCVKLCFDTFVEQLWRQCKIRRCYHLIQLCYVHVHVVQINVPFRLWSYNFPKTMIHTENTAFWLQSGDLYSLNALWTRHVVVLVPTLLKLLIPCLLTLCTVLTK